MRLHADHRSSSRLWGRDLRRFGRNSDGNVATILALCLTIIVGITGGAIDFGRYYKARVHTQNVMDAAVLAAGRALQTTQDDSEAIVTAKTYYSQMKSPLVVGPEPTFTIEGNGTMIVGTVEAKVNTVMLGVIDFTELPLKIRSQSGLAGGGAGGTNYEVSVMLDLTGSMCDDGVGPCASGAKIDALKTAAKDLVNILVWENQSTYTSRVALVPFSTRVRVAPDGGGGAMMKTLTNLDATWTGWYNVCTSWSGSGSSETGGNWVCNASAPQQFANIPIMPCVTDRTGPQEFSDSAPGANTWLNAHDGTRMTKSQDSSDTAATSALGGSSADPATHWNYEPGGTCSDVDPANQVVPLSADKVSLKAKIDALKAFGSTSGALGTAWSWYMMSPNWSTVWTGSSMPASYGDLTLIQDGKPKLKKVAVLMSDGDYNTYRGWKDSDPAMVSSNARTICQNMKTAGVEIYTIGFGLDQLPAGKRLEAENTLKSCGTDLEHFYQAFDAAELQSAFRDIGLKIALLRLTK